MTFFIRNLFICNILIYSFWEKKKPTKKIKKRDGPIFDYLQIINKKYRGAFLVYANTGVHT